MASREAGMGVVASPLVTTGVVHDYAAKNAVCVRPLLRLVTDRETGDAERLTIPCGSTREAVCPPCAGRARRLRMQQCAEGWHLEVDPFDVRPGDAEPERGSDERADLPPTRRVRSTRRRADVEELPRAPLEQRSVGRTFTAPDGMTYRPSMFVTLTLGSYGRVVSARPGVAVTGAGTPINPGRFDYRRAATEAMFFSRLFDRWVQNLRRCAGFVVQYFGAIEPQRRLAPHIHVAIRGAIPREVIRRGTAPETSPVFPDVIGGCRDRNNIEKDFRKVRAGTAFEWVVPHTYRKTVATLLDPAASLPGPSPTSSATPGYR